MSVIYLNANAKECEEEDIRNIFIKRSKNYIVYFFFMIYIINIYF